MLAPVLDGAVMIGTVSVHQQDATRHWTPADITALERAAVAVTAFLTPTRELRSARASRGLH
jgi:GAF domain-containing protein